MRQEPTNEEIAAHQTVAQEETRKLEKEHLDRLKTSLQGIYGSVDRMFDQITGTMGGMIPDNMRKKLAEKKAELDIHKNALNLEIEKSYEKKDN